MFCSSPSLIGSSEIDAQLITHRVFAKGAFLLKRGYILSLISLASFKTKLFGFDKLRKKFGGRARHREIWRILS